MVQLSSIIVEHYIRWWGIHVSYGSELDSQTRCIFCRVPHPVFCPDHAEGARELHWNLSIVKKLGTSTILNHWQDLQQLLMIKFRTSRFTNVLWVFSKSPKGLNLELCKFICWANASLQPSDRRKCQKVKLTKIQLVNYRIQISVCQNRDLILVFWSNKHPQFRQEDSFLE